MPKNPASPPSIPNSPNSPKNTRRTFSMRPMHGNSSSPTNQNSTACPIPRKPPPSQTHAPKTSKPQLGVSPFKLLPCRPSCNMPTTSNSAKPSGKHRPSLAQKPLTTTQNSFGKSSNSANKKPKSSVTRISPISLSNAAWLAMARPLSPLSRASTIKSTLLS